MGAIQSQTFEFQCNFAIYLGHLNKIETESPTRVYNRIMEYKFTSRLQMDAVITMIYEKAMLNPKLSLKCAQLMKELRGESFTDDEKTQHLFFIVLETLIVNKFKSIVENYTDTAYTKEELHRGKNLAVFLGHLYVTEAVHLTSIMNICKLAKKKETPKSAFFIESMLNIVAPQLEKNFNITIDMFPEFLENFNIDPLPVLVNYDFGDFEKADPTCSSLKNFYEFLNDIACDDKVRFYERYEDFLELSEEPFEINIRSLYKDALLNISFVCVYRDIALEIHHLSPEMLKKCLKREVNKTIERFEVIHNIVSDENFRDFGFLGKLIEEFYIAGLFDDEVVERYLTTAKARCWPIALFGQFFVDVSKKYFRKLDFFAYFQATLGNTKELKLCVSILEEQYKFKMEVASAGNGKNRVPGTNAAEFQDLRSFSAKSAKDPAYKTFECQNKLSCHLAAQRGVDMLLNHIGNKFFTPERIKICTKMVGSWIKLVSISYTHKFKFESKCFLPYIQNKNIEPSLKLKNFSILIGNFYNCRLIANDVVLKWYEDLYAMGKNTTNKFHQKYREAHSVGFREFSERMRLNNPNEWVKHSAFMDETEALRNDFKDFVKLKDLIKLDKKKQKFEGIAELKKLNIPEAKRPIQNLISKFLINFYIDEKSNISLISSFIAALLQKYSVQYTIRCLKYDLGEAMCSKMLYLIGKSSADKVVVLTDAKRIFELAKVLCNEKIISLMHIARIFSIISDAFSFFHENSYLVIFKECTEVLSSFFLLNESLPLDVEMEILKVIKNIEIGFKGDVKNQKNEKDVLKIFRDILKESQLKRKNEMKTKSSGNGLSDESDQEQAAIGNPSKTGNKKSSRSPVLKKDILDKQICSFSLVNRTEPSASHRAIEILFNHINNKFFTPDHIDICTKMIKAWPSADLSDKFNDKMKSESKTLLGYIQTDNSKTDEIFNKFLTLIGYFYKMEIVDQKIIENWLDQLFIDSGFKFFEKFRNVLKSAGFSEDLIKNYSIFGANKGTCNKMTIKSYSQYCEYYNSINDKVTADDNQFFDAKIIQSLKITQQEEVVDFCKKLIDRVINNPEAFLCFLQCAIKLNSCLDTFFRLKNQNFKFRSILVAEVYVRFQNQHILVEFMSELYNANHIDKKSMVEFVDRFKDPKTENLELLHIYVRTCAIRLANQGDKEQLIQIRNVAKNMKSMLDLDENFKFIAQDLHVSVSSLIKLNDTAQKRPQYLSLNEKPEKIIGTLLKKAFKNPYIAASAATKFDGKLKEFLNHSCQDLIKNLPELTVSEEEFKNFMEFVAEAYNLNVINNEMIEWIFNILLEKSIIEISCQSLDILLQNCGSKLEISNKSKLDAYFQFFQAVLAEYENSKRDKYFKKFIKLRAKNWTISKVPENFYKDFLILYSVNDTSVEELTSHLQYDDEEIIKFIQCLWKILLKEAPNPSYATLCLEISKSYEYFLPQLTTFLTARCMTFTSLNEEIFTADVKERLGKVVTFIAEIYCRGLIDNRTLEMWIDLKLAEKLPGHFVEKIFKILTNESEKLTKSKNDENLKRLIDNLGSICYEFMDGQMDLIIKELNELK